MIYAMETNVILSLIFVPALTVLFVLMLIFMFAKRTPDTIVSLMYELKLTEASLGSGKPFGKRELKKLDMRVSKLQLWADKAAFEDIYDMGIAQSAFDKVREITAALHAAQPEDHRRYIALAHERLQPAVDYLVNVTGIELDRAVSFNYKIFSKTAKREKAEKFLAEMDKKNDA